jgi:hypothetical protein
MILYVSSIQFFLLYLKLIKISEIKNKGYGIGLELVKKSSKIPLFDLFQTNSITFIFDFRNFDHSFR